MPLSANKRIITCNESSLLDTMAVDKNEIPSIVLMEEASEKLFLQLYKDFTPSQEKIAVIAGWGNNGGDALCVARKLHFNNIPVDIYIFPDKIGSVLYQTHFAVLNTLNIPLRDVQTFKATDDYTLIIDGIFGIGYSYRKNTLMEQVFTAINESPAAVVAIDVPSGLDTHPHLSVNADFTYSVGFLKDIFYTLHTRKACGIIKDLKISFDINNITPENDIFHANDYITKPKKKTLSNFVHKYSRGGCIAIGGQKGKLGSILYSAESALNAGAGISLILTEEENVMPVNMMSKKVICDEFSTYESYHDKYKVVIAGPGLHFNNQTSRDTVTSLLQKTTKQCILDASFFTLFDKTILTQLKKMPVLTPHTGEFATFFKDEAQKIKQKTIETVSAMAVKYRSYIILKDVFLTIGMPDGKTYIYDNPNRILAQAGSGDIFAGLIGGLAAQPEYTIEDAIFEAIRIFYTIAKKLQRSAKKSYSPEVFTELIMTEI